jgi:acylphosphatase
VVVSGPDEALPEFEHLLRRGPANSQVEALERSSEPGPASPANSFDII